MVCVDGSSSCEKVFQKLESMVTPEDVIYIFHAYQLPPWLSAPDSFRKGLQKRKAQGFAIVEDAKVKISKLKNVNMKKVTTEVVQAEDVREAIVEFAKEHRITTVILGTRGFGNIKGTLLGSVSNYVVKYAECPVLVVR